MMSVRAAAAPMRYTASTLPTRSTTAMVAFTCRAFASATPWAMICCTSPTVRKVEAFAQLPVHSTPAGEGLVPTELTAEPPPEHAATIAATAIDQNPLPIFIVILPHGLPRLWTWGDTHGNS